MLLTLSRVCLCDCVCVTVWCVCACVCVSLSGGGGRAPLPVFIRRDSKQLTINQKSLCRGAILLACFLEFCARRARAGARGRVAPPLSRSDLGSGCSRVAVGEEQGVRPMRFP